MKNLLSLAVCLLTLVGCTKNVTETQTPVAQNAIQTKATASATVDVYVVFESLREITTSWGGRLGLGGWSNTIYSAVNPVQCRQYGIKGLSFELKNVNFNGNPNETVYMNFDLDLSEYGEPIPASPTSYTYLDLNSVKVVPSNISVNLNVTGVATGTSSGGGGTGPGGGGGIEPPIDPITGDTIL